MKSRSERSDLPKVWGERVWENLGEFGRIWEKLGEFGLGKLRGNPTFSKKCTFPLDGFEGSMNQLKESLSLLKFIDSFHLTKHQVVADGPHDQFSDSVTFLCLPTPHLLSNMARAVNCCSQKQGHTDGAVNWCGKEITLIGFDMNRMGAHLNQVSISIVNEESIGLKKSYQATYAGLYTLYNAASLCTDKGCGFCIQIHALVSEDGSLWSKELK